MADLINLNGLLVSREKESLGYAPVRIGFRVPITDESLRSLAAFAYCLAEGEKEIAEKLGIEPVPIEHCDCGATNETDARKMLGLNSGVN